MLHKNPSSAFQGSIQILCVCVCVHERDRQKGKDRYRETETRRQGGREAILNNFRNMKIPNKLYFTNH